mgnify:CR=1 FL=1
MSIHNLPRNADLRRDLIVTAMRDDRAYDPDPKAAAKYVTDFALEVERRLADADAETPTVPADLLRIRANVSAVGRFEGTGYVLQAALGAGGTASLAITGSKSSPGVEALRGIGRVVARDVEIIVREV